MASETAGLGSDSDPRVHPGMSLQGAFAGLCSAPSVCTTVVAVLCTAALAVLQIARLDLELRDAAACPVGLPHLRGEIAARWEAVGVIA